MSLNTVRLRPMRRADVDELVDLLRRTWYADGDPQTRTMVARADLEFCLARTTTAHRGGISGASGGRGARAYQPKECRAFSCESPP